MFSDIIKYMGIRAENLESMESAINDMITKGYVPLGRLSSGEGIWKQLMVKYDKNSDSLSIIN
tara:strand:- start:916 stop:1104 length:189 start_codon:yes stop_codon:yes gene_type:complete